MTTDSKKFFKDNINRIDREKEPILYNMNHGFLALCQQVDEVVARQREIIHALRTIAQTSQTRWPSSAL